MGCCIKMLREEEAKGVVCLLQCIYEREALFAASQAENSSSASSFFCIVLQKRNNATFVFGMKSSFLKVCWTCNLHSLLRCLECFPVPFVIGNFNLSFCFGQEELVVKWIVLLRLELQCVVSTQISLGHSHSDILLIFCTYY